MFFGGRQRVRAGPLEDRQRHRRIAVEIGVGGVVLRGQLDARHVLEADDGARGLLHHDIGELVRIGEAAQRLHRESGTRPASDRRLVEHAGGDLDVLRLQRDVTSLAVRPSDLQPVGVEPDAHRIVAAAEHRDRADPVDAGQRVLDRQRRHSWR